jgi:uncharacterized phage protein gp47/JayE
MADGYKFLQTLMDVTIPSMSANQVLNINSQGYAGGTNYMTAGTVTTTNAQPYAVEVVSVEIISPTEHAERRQRLGQRLAQHVPAPPACLRRARPRSGAR